jgi:hypothetical protein
VKTPAREGPETAAQAFVAECFPDATVALLCGSAGRGEARAGSDLDLVIIVERSEAPYRETFRAGGWPIEAFVYTPASYRTWFENDVRRRRPSLPTMCAEGKVLLDQGGLAASIQDEARALLAAGPAPLGRGELAAARYRVTDLLMDLEGAGGNELSFIAIALVPALADLICDSHGQWRGDAKWIPRAIRAFAPPLAERLENAVTSLKGDDPQPLIALADEALDRVGGRLFEGYAAGKNSDRNQSR